MPYTTTVTGTIVDNLGQVWAFAKVLAIFRPNPNASQNVIWLGGAFPTIQPLVTADINGSFSIVLPDNNDIAPSGSQWTFVISPNATMPASVFDVLITGATQSINTQIAEYVISAQIAATPVPMSYNPAVETILPLNQGALVYNSSSGQLMFWNGTAWAVIEANLNTGVTAFNTRTGSVTLLAADVDSVGNITNNTSGNAATATLAANASTVVITKWPFTGQTIIGNATFTLPFVPSTMLLFYNGQLRTDYMQVTTTITMPFALTSGDILYAFLFA
jgi:hypothetical protein